MTTLPVTGYLSKFYNDRRNVQGARIQRWFKKRAIVNGIVLVAYKIGDVWWHLFAVHGSDLSHLGKFRSAKQAFAAFRP